MANPPPRPAASRTGGPASGGATPSASGLRSKEPEKQQPGTFFLGRYRVVDEIGTGGMASVHLARMDGPGGFQKWVAIKRIHPHLVEDDQFVDMFLDEARIAAGINHANVAQVFDLGKDDNTYWIAMEYLHGEPLREVMRRAEERRMRISPELAARICADAADGLHAAHELRGKNGQLLGLVHRDVTPHNLFLTYDGYTKVVDFGIAKVADRLSSTRAGTLKGKLAYMSPEQVRGAEVDRTTDIFALGVVLWELTTNQRLFRRDTDLDTLEQVQACIVPPPSTIVPNYPVELESVVMKALSKRKQDRYPTGREFSRALQGFLMRQGAFVGPEEVSQFVRTVFADRIQKREAHLAWAAEVTSTINVDQLRAGNASLPGSAQDLDLNDRDDDRPPQRGAPPPPQASPPSGARPVAPPPPPQPTAQQQAIAAQMASMSLMDDDEDVPTTVAMREQLENAARVAMGAQQPRPAAGMPAPPGAPPQQNGARPGYGPQPTQLGGYVAPQQQQPPQQQYNQQQRPYAPPQTSEHTAALPAPSEDLGATVALPMSAKSMDALRGPYGQPQQQQQPPQQQQQPPQQQQGYNGQGGYGQQPQQQQPPSYGFGQQQAPTPQYGQPGNPSTGQQQPQQQHYPPLGPQSQIETALSLPRPDPAALWLAQQEKQRGERKNMGLIIAVVALVALCVIGGGLLIVLKLRASSSSHAVSPEASASASAATGTSTASAGTAGSASAAPPVETAVASAAPTATPTAAPTAVVATGPAPTGAAAAVKDPKASAGKDEPGFLTIVCNPYCDDVIDQGKSLGPSPIVHLAVKPGQHRITLKKGSQTKVISVIVESGQVAAQRVSMK